MTRTRTSSRFFALLPQNWGLGGLLLLAALPHAALAQSLTLNSGDTATVSGAGTVGTIGGTPVANTTTSYSGSPAVRTNGTSTFTLATGGTLTAGNSGAGLFATGSSTVTINGGTFTAGQNGFGLDANGSNPVTINGGTFTAGPGGYDLFTVGSTINLFGSFVGYSLGTTTLTDDTGSFVGTLTDNTTSQTFTYQNIYGGSIILNNIAAAPEPSQYAAFAIGLLGLGALTVKARRRTSTL